jgi:hypothetical protein
MAKTKRPVAHARANSHLADSAFLKSQQWKPTKLGIEFMRRIPRYAEAVHITTNIDLADENTRKARTARAELDAAYDTMHEIDSKILRRPITSAAHLVDLAIVSEFWCDGRDADGDIFPLQLIRRRILKAARITRAQCGPGAYIEKLEKVQKKAEAAQMRMDAAVLKKAA